MSLSRIARLVLVLAVMVMGVGVITPAAAQGDNTLIMARAVDATGLDPHTQTAFASLRLLELIYEPLILADENLNLVPALAESWAFSEGVSRSSRSILILSPLSQSSSSILGVLSFSL